MTDQEVAELLYQFRMNNSIHENYSLLFNPKVSTEEIRSKIRPMLMSEDRVNELKHRDNYRSERRFYRFICCVCAGRWG